MRSDFVDILYRRVILYTAEKVEYNREKKQGEYGIRYAVCHTVL